MVTVEVEFSSLSAGVVVVEDEEEEEEEEDFVLGRVRITIPSSDASISIFPRGITHVTSGTVQKGEVKIEGTFGVTLFGAFFPTTVVAVEEETDDKVVIVLSKRIASATFSNWGIVAGKFCAISRIMG